MSTQTAVSIPHINFCPETAAKIKRTDAAVRWLWAQGSLKSQIRGGRRFSTDEQIAEFLTGDA